jgi:hypothetical protein
VRQTRSMHKHKHKKEHRSKDPKMSTMDELELLYTSAEAPINPTNGYKKPDKAGDGYLFYQKIREYLAEWWEEFNGDLDNYGRLKYETIRGFIKSKTKSEKQRAYLYQMLGAVAKREEGCQVPWLGDWEKRRRCGFGVLDQPEKIKPLVKMIQNNMQAAESIKSLTPILVSELVQYDALQKQVHEAYAGKGFGSGKADDKRNVSRFNQYKSMLWALSELKITIIGEIMRVHGVDPKTPQQMRDMAAMAGGIGAAAAITGLAAQQAGILGVRSTDGSVVAPYTYDAIKLAEHLTRHAHTFKKPLPPIIEAEVDSSSSSSKSNGHGKTQ